MGSRNDRLKRKISRTPQIKKQTLNGLLLYQAKTSELAGTEGITRRPVGHRPSLPGVASGAAPRHGYGAAPFDRPLAEARRPLGAVGLIVDEAERPAGAGGLHLPAAVLDEPPPKVPGRALVEVVRGAVTLQDVEVPHTPNPYAVQGGHVKQKNAARSSLAVTLPRAGPAHEINGRPRRSRTSFLETKSNRMCGLRSVNSIRSRF